MYSPWTLAVSIPKVLARCRVQLVVRPPAPQVDRSMQVWPLSDGKSGVKDGDVMRQPMLTRTRIGPSSRHADMPMDDLQSRHRNTTSGAMQHSKSPVPLVEW